VRFIPYGISDFAGIGRMAKGMEKIKPQDGHDSPTESEPAVSRSTSYVMIFLTYCFGAISIIVFVIFLYKGSLKLDLTFRNSD
jgi:hypothetical protein